MHRIKLTLAILVFSLFTGHLRAQINTDRVMDIGRNALYFEDYILSIQYFNKVIRVKPYLPEPYFYRAIAKYSLDDYRGAQLDCEKVIELNPFMINVYNLKGVLQERMGDSKLAVDAFSQGLELESTNLSLLFNRGLSYSNLKDYPNSIEDFTEVLKYDPKNSSALGSRGMAKLAAGDTIGCQDDLTKMIAYDSYSPSTYTTRGMLYYRQGKFDLALLDMDKAIELSPTEIGGLYLNRGVVRYQLDDLKGTMADFDKVIELEPKNVMAYTNRGILRAQVGDINRAIDDFSRVLALDPNDMMILFYQADLYSQIGQYNRALYNLNIIAEAYPRYGPLYQKRAQVKQMLNDKKGAQLDYSTAMKLDHDKMERDLKNEKKDPSKEVKATRKKSDKDLKNYNKLALADDFGEEEQEPIVAETIRGKVQNKDVAINLEPMFGLSYFAADSAANRRVFYNKEVDAYNKRKSFNRSLQFTNREVEEEGGYQSKSDRYFYISNYSAKIEFDTLNNDLLLTRGVLYSSVLNFNSALADYDKVLSHDKFNTIAYFNRAYSRFKMVEIIKSLEPDKRENTLSFAVQGQKKSSPVQSSSETSILDYDLVISDLDKVIAIEGTNEYAYFNRGYVRSNKRDFEGALSDFTKAIEINPYFAEAYFNRGLTLIYLQEIDNGIFDLSKAGELGLYKAYNVIKRYGVKATKEEDN